jgi:hypothetical protein
MTSPKVFAFDFETYYSKTCSITVAGMDAYLRHPEFDAYMLTVAGSDGTRYAGPPEGFDWTQFNGAVLVAHNMAFDGPVARWLFQKGKIPAFSPAAMHCTADMVAYLGVPRSLKDSSSFLLGVTVDKSTRDDMKNQKWEEMTPEFREEVTRYAVKDAELCLELWLKFSDQWPEHERELSALTRSSADHGMYLDADGVKQDIDHLSGLLADIERRIPWAYEGALLSYPSFCEHVRALGLVPPASLDKKNKETEQWCAEHPDITWVSDMQAYRSINALREKLRSLLERVREDGTVATPLMYAGAHTLRDSGTSGVNFQNLPRGEMYGVNLRNRLQARPGYVLVAADLSAIEPRALTYLARDFGVLEASRGVSDWYEAQARAWGMYAKPEPLKVGDPDLRTMFKAMAIGVGYGMSANKLATVAEMALERAQQIVGLFRSKNERLLKLWNALDRGLRSSVGEDYSVTLPSGRSVLYRSVAYTPGDKEKKGGVSCLFAKQGFVRMRVWFGTIVENITQAFARDVFMEKVMQIHKAGWQVVLRVHDEVVCEVPEDRVDEAKAQILQIMKASPTFAPDLPLDSSVNSAKTYYEAK